MNPHFGMLVLAVLSTLFVITMLWLSHTLGPKNKTVTKQLPFECGSVSVGKASEQRYNVAFYPVAVIFIVFDLEVVFLYPWAVSLQGLGWGGFFQMLLFVLVLGIGLAFVWARGVFEHLK